MNSTTLLEYNEHQTKPKETRIQYFDFVETTYWLEAYDKDNDYYIFIESDKDINRLKQLGQRIWQGFGGNIGNIRNKYCDNEPIDWLMITKVDIDDADYHYKRICFLDPGDHAVSPHIYSKWIDYND